MHKRCLECLLNTVHILPPCLKQRNNCGIVSGTASSCVCEVYQSSIGVS